VSVTANSNSDKGLVINASSTISSLTVAADTELNITDEITFSGATEIAEDKTLTLSSTGTFGSTLNLKGTLQAGASLTVSGLISVGGDSAISIPSAEKTLTYSGGDLDVGANTLSIEGAGTLGNSSDSALVLDVADSILDLTGSGTVSGPVKLESGTLKSSGSPTISGAITQSAAATIEVSTDQTLTYSGAALSLGAYTLTMSGEGRFSNSNALVLNNASSKLLLSNSITVDRVSTSLASLGLDVDNNSTVSSLTVGHTTPVSIASGQTLSGAITVTAGSIKLGEAGTLASTVSMSGGTLDADETRPVWGALRQ